MMCKKLSVRFLSAVLLLLTVTVSVQAQAQAQAQFSTVGGHIYSSDGKPASNVNVVIEELQKGSESNSKGEYIINRVPTGHYTLSVSFVGTKSIKMAIEVVGGENLHVKDIVLTEDSKRLNDVEVVAFRKKKADDQASLSVAKLLLTNLENPQVYNTISSNLLKEQVATNLNSALKNATGIARLWESTGRGSDGAEYYTMRGFSLQPTIVNGVASISNGALDPANVENIEVIKGPSGTLYGGSLVYYGGLINLNTKKPYDTFGGELGYVTGSNGLNRVTADINNPLSEKVSMRVNAAYHTENSFQDQGFAKSFFIAPGFKIKASDRLTFLINTEFKSSERANAPMIFLNRYSKLSFSNIDLFEQNYSKSYTSNQLSIKNPTYGSQTQALYRLGSGWNSQTVLSTSTTKSDGYYQYLWDNSNGDDFTRYISKINSSTNALDLQQNFMGDHRFGTIRNRLVVGLDFLQRNYQENSAPWVADGVVSLSTQHDTGALTTAGVDALLAAGGATTLSSASVRVKSVYASDVINFTPNLSALAGLRLDDYTAHSSSNSKPVDDQVTFSQKFGLVYQPVLNKVSLFANYMNGFQNLEPVAQYDASGNSTMKILKPEQANQWEAGVKTNLYKDRISLTASYYDIRVSNKTMADPTNALNVIQGGKVVSRGVEVSLDANPFEGMSVVTGYSHNYNRITKDAADGGYIGLRSEDAGPADMFNFWASYKVGTGALKGWSIGAGSNYASKYNTLNRHVIGSFALPSYTIFNALVSYSGDSYTVSLKGDNLGNVKYYGGWSTVTPQKLRTIALALNYRF